MCLVQWASGMQAAILISDNSYLAVHRWLWGWNSTAYQRTHSKPQSNWRSHFQFERRHFYFALKWLFSEGEFLFRSWVKHTYPWAFLDIRGLAGFLALWFVPFWKDCLYFLLISSSEGYSEYRLVYKAKARMHQIGCHLKVLHCWYPWLKAGGTEWAEGMFAVLTLSEELHLD